MLDLRATLWKPSNKLLVYTKLLIMWKFPKLVVPLKVADMGSRNSKTEGQLRLGEIVRVFPYLLDLVWVKFCHSVAHSVMRLEPLSSLGALICNVISLGSKPKVGRIDASRIVSSRAIVKNKQARWDLSEVNNPAGPMSQNISGEPPALTNHSVPVGPDRSNPYPTIIGKSYFGEESGEKGGIESKFLKGCHALIIAPRLCIATPNKLFSIWWILSLFLCLPASAQLPVFSYLLPNAASPPPTNFPALMTGNEHFWLARDLTNGVLNVWTDRGPAHLSWFKYAGDASPTNTDIGLGFYGGQAITNSDKNSSGSNSSMSTDDTANLRLFCVAYTTTNGINMGFLGDVAVGSVGFNMNATGGAGNQAGNVNYQTTASDHILCTGLKTDGTLQDYCVGQTNSGAPFGMEGYTNGTLCLQLAPAAGMVREPMLSIGEGFNLTKAFVLAVATYTNVNRTVTASNWHWWRTNIFGGSP